MATLVSEQRLEPDPSEISSPRSVSLSLAADSETMDDENATQEEEEENKDDEGIDIENRIYSITQLIKLAKDTECQVVHEVLKSPKYSSIKSHSCVAVHDILDSSKMNRRRRTNYQGGGMSREIFGTRKPKKKTPKGNKKPHQRGKYNDFPPLLR